MWRFDQGSAEVEVRFSAKVKRLLVVSTYQMLILHCFADGVAAHSFREIRDTIFGTSESAFAAAKIGICNALLSLAHPEYAVLEKKPNNKALEDDHLFRLNNKFSSKLLRVKIPTLSLYSANTVNDSSQAAAIMQQRSYMAQASIVRIMKIRKTLEHSKLMAEVIAQLRPRFTIDLVMIKKCIETLITGEYMRRDDDDRSLYHYMA
jgi:cullin 3